MALTDALTGGKCFGYSSKLEIVEDEAAVVLEIFTRYAGGEAQRAIARGLNRRGVPSPGASWRREAHTASGPWHVAALHAILHNERYTGRMVWGQSRWIRGARDSKERRRVDVPESEWVRFERPELRFIDDATWERVRLRDAPTGSTNARPKYALSGLLVCGECGADRGRRLADQAAAGPVARRREFHRGGRCPEKSKFWKSLTDECEVGGQLYRRTDFWGAPLHLARNRPLCWLIGRQHSTPPSHQAL